MYLFDELRCRDAAHTLGGGKVNEPRSHAVRRRRRQHRRANIPPVPPYNEYVPETPLMAIWRARRQQATRERSVHEVERQTVVDAFRQADGERFERSHTRGSRELQQADLRRTQRKRHVCGEAGVVALASVRIDACGEIERSEHRPLGVRFHLSHRLEDRPQDRVEAGVRADAEHRVEYEVGERDVASQLPAFEVFRRLDHTAAALAALLELVLPPPRRRHVERHHRSPVRQVTRRDHSVAAVVPRPHQHNDTLAPHTVQAVCDAARNRESRTLHQ